jgi:phage-related minor tail protein
MGPADVGLIFFLAQTDHTDMAAEQMTGILANASTVTKEVPAATRALKELAGATEVTNVALKALRLDSRIEFTLKAGRYVGEAAVDGARENATYSRARTSSGNYAGMTNDQLRRMEEAIAGPLGSRAKAAEALSGMVASGQVQGHVLQQAATAAFEMNRLGVPFKKTVDDFSKIADDPLKGSQELNKSRNYLTPEIVKQIIDLQSQGQNQAAVAIAQKAFAVDSIQRSRQEVQDMTFFDRGRLIARELSELPKDIVRNVGRGTTLRRDYEQASTERENRMRRDGGAGSPMVETGGGAVVGFARRPASSSWDDKVENLRELQALQARSAVSQGARASQDKESVDSMLEAKNASERNEAVDAIVDKLEARSSKKVLTQSASISADRSRGSSAARGSDTGIQHAGRDGLRPRIEVVCCDCKAGTTDSSKQSFRKGQAGEAAPSQSKAGDGAEQSARETEEERQEKLLNAMRKATSGVLEQTTALEAQNAVHGKTKSAVQELNIAQLERQYQDLDNTDKVIPGYVDALGARIDAEKTLLKVTRGAEGIEASGKEKKKSDDKAAKLSDDIGSSFREGFVGLLEGKDNVLDKLGESLKKKITASVADALYEATLKPAVEGFSNWLSGAIKGVFPSGGSSSGGSSSGGATGSDSSGSWIGSAVSALLGFFGVKSANGNVFASPGLHAYANSVVGKPTFFPFANGIGLMGEAGPEAIMPLRRGSDGRLGVSAPGGANSVPTIQFAPSNVFHIDARSDRGAVMADMQRLLAENNRGQMEQLKRVKVLPQ